MGYLEDFMDPGLPKAAGDNWVPTDHVRGEALALCAHVQVLRVAAAMPRRLGAQASRQQLARDKRVARRCTHVVEQFARAWGATTVQVDKPPTEEQRVQGAQLDLATWHADRCAHVRTQRAYVATVCVRLGLRQAGNVQVQRYTLELRQLGWAVR